MSTKAKVKPPTDLGPAGSALYGAAMQQCDEWSFDELQVLELACRNADRLKRISELIDLAGVTVVGGRTVRPHPLLAEERERQKLLAQLLRQLGVPALHEEAAVAPSGPPHLSVVPDEEVAKRARSEQARKAARARWDRAHHA